MVPGMTERERLAADMRRLEWLAEAQLGPARVSWTPTRTVTAGSRPALPLGLWRRGIASALVLGQRVRMLRPGTGDQLQPAVEGSGR